MDKNYTFKLMKHADVLRDCEVDENAFPHIDFHKPNLTDNHLAMCCIDGNRLVGIATLYSGKDAANIDIGMFEVSTTFLERGIGRALMENLFPYAKDQGKILTSQRFTEEGSNYLTKVIGEQCRIHGDNMFTTYQSC